MSGAPVLFLLAGDAPAVAITAPSPCLSAGDYDFEVHVHPCCRLQQVVCGGRACFDVFTVSKNLVWPFYSSSK